MVVNYAEACVYKIYCIDPNIKECYVGSTTNFRERKTGHKSRCNNEKNKSYNSKVYKFIRENGGWFNWNMIELEKVNCNDCKTLHKIERNYIEKLGASLNIQTPSRTKRQYDKEYRKDNKGKIKEYKKEYYEKNKEYHKENRNLIITCICGCEIKQSKKARHFKTKKHRIRISKIKLNLHNELLAKIIKIF